MIEVEFSSHEIIVAQISTISMSLRNTGGSAYWDVAFELNLPPDGISILEGRKAIITEYFPQNSTLEHHICLLAKKPGTYVLTSRRFHYYDSRGNLNSLEWQTAITASGGRSEENDSYTTEIDNNLVENFWGNNESEKQKTRDPLAQIHRDFMQSFNMDEIRLICLEMSIDFEILSGDNKNRKILDLLLFCQRQGTIDRLLEICRRDRPRFDW